MSNTNPISFRISAHHRQLLEGVAVLAGLESADLMARKILVAHLDSETQAGIAERLALLEEQLTEARRDLSVATEVILIHGGKLSESTAKEWVSENLKPR